MKKYSIKGFGAIGKNRVEMFELAVEMLTKHSMLRDQYYVTPLEKKLTTESIREFLLRNAASSDRNAAFSIFDTKDSGTIDQSVIYFPGTGKFGIVFSLSELDSPDQFLTDWISEFSTCNAVCSLMEYAISFQDKWFKPPNSNLFQGLGLSNDRNGYIEGVSAEMWFGDSFWQHAKCTKKTILRQDWLHCEERPTHLYVRAWPEPFSSAEDEQGEIQRRLLDLIFGINGKTPPPLPAPPQSTIVQKVIVDGESVRDLGMEEVLPDGSRVSITPPEPPPLRECDEARLANAIRQIKASASRNADELLKVMLTANGFLIVPDFKKPANYAIIPHPDNGAELLVCFTSKELAQKVYSKVGIMDNYIVGLPLEELFLKADGKIGIILNPMTDLMLVIPAASVEQVGESLREVR